MQLGTRVRAVGTRVIDHHFVATSQGKLGTVISNYTLKAPGWKQKMITVRWDDNTTFSCPVKAAGKWLERA